jgi:isoleucyl-tRNA synthetase
MPKVEERPETVHLTKFPAAEEILGTSTALNDAKQLEDWSTLRSVREQVLKALEEARNAKQIGVGLEAQVTLTAPESIYSVLARYKEQLRYLFIVSTVKLEQSATGNGSSPGVSIQISKAEGKKCERCWNYSARVGEDLEYPTVCERCSAVLKEIEAAAAHK